MWRFAGHDPATAHMLVETALSAGITLFDTADIYGTRTAGFGSSEHLLGNVLRSAPRLRSDMILATKGGLIPGVPYDSSGRHLEQALDASLQRLGLEQVDLWQIHRPDLLTHPQEVARTLETIVESGKARAIGVSNYAPAQLTALQSYLPFPLASTQPEFSALHSAPLWDGTLDQAMEREMAVLAWSPLGGGRIGQDGGDVTELLETKAVEFGVSRAAAAFAWVMTHPAHPIPIVGSQSPERIRAATDAFKVQWSRSEWYQLLQASMGRKLP
ncbi:aldo/keto reductase [Sphingomonas oryzagri]